MKIPEEIAKDIKNRATIEEVIGSFVSLKKKGASLEGECPFCNLKKFSVSPAKQIYKCWGCEKGGNNSITFLMEKENRTYIEALEWLADFYKIIIQEQPNRDKPVKPKPVMPVKSDTVIGNSTSKRGLFLKQTLRSVGLTTETNKVTLKWFNKPHQSETLPLLAEDKEGNIEFLVYDINGFVVTYEKNTDGGIIDVPYKILRLKEPILDKKGHLMKYMIPKGIGTRPFFPPGLLQKYLDRTQINTLFITEGYKKAISGWVNGIDIVGLTSISTYRDKETMQLHRDVVELIITCKVQNVVLLYDGDCRNISTKAFEEEKDILSRPNNFFSSARGIKELLKDYLKDHEISLYFSHINSEAVEGAPKGLDDIYEQMFLLHYRSALSSEDSNMEKGRKLVLARKQSRELLNADLYAFSRPGIYFTKLNITHGLSRLLSHLAIDNVNNFYHAHQEIIKDRFFIYNGTQYRYLADKNECEIIIPAASKNYLRVGDDYYEKVRVPNKYKDLEEQLHRRIKTTISDDHGKNFLTHIKKFKAFCSIPDHVNYQEVIHNCYNMYAKFEHEPEEGPCPASLEFVRHIFEEHYELGLDYLQLLYQRPTQILPILCLVSRENNTGKSTFAKWLKAIFKQNMAIVGNAELASDFNGAFACKKIICCDEAFIDKKTVIEKIKSLSTADRITLNQKGKDHVEIEFFGAFILLTNNEDNFIYANEDDIRYWVRKISKPKTDRVNMLSEMISEIPAFLNFLNKRTMKTQVASRMWFSPKDLVTDALKRVVAHSKPMIEKELRIKLENMFMDYSENIIYMTLGDIRKELLNNRFEEKYVDSVLRENLKVDNYWEPHPTEPSKRQYKVKRYSYPKWHISYSSGSNGAESVRQDVKCTGRPFVFLRTDFLSPAIEATLQHDDQMLSIMADVPAHYWRDGMLDMNRTVGLSAQSSELPF